MLFKLQKNIVIIKKNSIQTISLVYFNIIEIQNIFPTKLKSLVLITIFVQLSKKKCVVYRNNVSFSNDEIKEL